MDPFQIQPESVLGGRWPIRWRPGTGVEGGTRFLPSGFQVCRILPLLIYIVVEKLIKGSPVGSKAQKKKKDEIVFIPGTRRVPGTWLVVVVVVVLIVVVFTLLRTW